MAEGANMANAATTRDALGERAWAVMAFPLYGAPMSIARDTVERELAHAGVRVARFNARDDALEAAVAPEDIAAAERAASIIRSQLIARGMATNANAVIEYGQELNFTVAANVDKATAEKLVRSALEMSNVPVIDLAWEDGDEKVEGHVAVPAELADAARAVVDDAMAAIRETDWDQAGVGAERGDGQAFQGRTFNWRKTIVVNMFGGPGSGKTTAAFEVMEKLKKAGYVVEYAPEYAKELVWMKDSHLVHPAQRMYAKTLLDGEIKHQTQLMNNQIERIRRCVGQCDFVVTDSPIALAAFYLKPASDEQLERFEWTALEAMREFENFNMFVERDVSRYEPEGRLQTAEEAAKIDAHIERFLKSNELYYGTYDHDRIDVAIANMQKTHARVTGRGNQAEGYQAKNARPAAKTNVDATADRRAAAVEETGKVIRMAEETTNQVAQEGQAPAANATRPEREYIPFPKAGYQGQELIRPFTGKDGRNWVEVKLPPHMPEVRNVDGETVDVSNRKFIVAGGEAVAVQTSKGELGVRTGSVTAWNNDPNYKEVSFPKTNKDGQPWNIELRKDIGHWENPDAEGPARGKWIKDGEAVDRVEVATQLAPAMDTYRQQRREYMQQKSESRNITPPGADKPAHAEKATIQKDVTEAKHAAPASKTAPRRAQTQGK